MHFQIQTTVTSGWYKKGSAPTVKSFPGRFKTSYSGFVIPESGILFTAKPEKFNYETTIDSVRSFLTAHPVPEGKKYALVMDNAPWHKKTMRLIEQEMLPEYEDIRKSVAFIKLPPYSPDLNPIEFKQRPFQPGVKLKHTKTFPFQERINFAASMPIHSKIDRRE